MSIARTKTITVGDLPAAERERLGPQLVSIVLESFKFPDKEMIRERVVFRAPSARLLLLYRADDSIAGFASLGLSRFCVAGREHAVISMGMYSSPDLRRTRKHAIPFLLAEVLRFKLRHPRTPLCLVGEATSPASYLAAVSSLPGLHPRRNTPTPEHLTELVRAVSASRGMTPVDDDPWRVSVRLPFGFRDRERIERHAAKGNPDVDFFVVRNPGYLKGDWLMVYAPLDTRYLLHMGASFLRRRLAKPRVALH